ncbi:MAG: hypothetical protein JKY65_15725 [Planctomycetes bacterium]|nr:hypothetical protein [Planctomycetota bacterium]
MSQAPPAAPSADPSSFYRLNEEIAAEVRRLEEAGALAPLQELLRAGGQELLVASVRRSEGLEELVGVLGPGVPAAPAASQSTAPAPLPPALEQVGDPACDCGPAGEAADEGPSDAQRPGWDAESYLAVRSRFTTLFPDGQARELYMPDHVCPVCLNDEANWIEDCGRACAACDFRW